MGVQQQSKKTFEFSWCHHFSSTTAPNPQHSSLLSESGWAGHMDGVAVLSFVEAAAQSGRNDCDDSQIIETTECCCGLRLLRMNKKETEVAKHEARCGQQSQQQQERVGAWGRLGGATNHCWRQVPAAGTLNLAELRLPARTAPSPTPPASRPAPLSL
jgi:hypothetical protein